MAGPGGLKPTLRGFSNKPALPLLDMDTVDIKGIFSPGGVLCQSLTGFEQRPEQVEMANAVNKALLQGGRLAVEAGTGVGKSFAYL